MARPPKNKSETEYKVPADTSLLSDQELLEIELQAQKEYEAEIKEQTIAAIKEEKKKELARKSLFSAGKDAEGEEIESITIDLAPHSPDITLDGRKFFHGMTYKFTKAQAATIKEAMFRTWQHEREIGGANMNAERGYRALNSRI